MPTLTELFAKAADLLEARGLIKKKAYGRNGELCTSAAIYETAARIVPHRLDSEGMQKWYTVFSNGREYLVTILAEKGWNSSLSEWNDRKETTKEDAIKLLREAATRVSEEGR